MQSEREERGGGEVVARERKPGWAGVEARHA
jgi:hypothetical protein